MTSSNLSSCGFIAIVSVLIFTVPAVAADKFRKLKNNEIRAKLAGMEITDEVHWSELYNRDGTLTVYSMGKKTTGKWLAKGDQLCLDDAAQNLGCKEVWLSGNKVEFRHPGSTLPFEGILQKQRPR
jgi:hypothetical protein